MAEHTPRCYSTGSVIRHHPKGDVVCTIDANTDPNVITNYLNDAAAARDSLAKEVERLRDLVRFAADRLFLPIDDQPRDILREKLLSGLREEQS